MSDDALREMSERAHLLDELTRHPGWAAFQQCADEELAKNKRAILSGGLNPEQYQRTTGFLAGGEMVAAIPDAMMSLYLAAVARQREEEAELDDERQHTNADHPLPV